MTREQAGELLGLLVAAHPRVGARIEDATLRLWRDALEPLDYQLGTQAVRSLIAAVRVWPSIAHLNEHVAIVREQAARERRGVVRREAEKAWEQMERPPLREIPAVVEFLARRTGEPVDQLDQVGEGPCADCGAVGVRYRLGRFQVCRGCVLLRLRAGGRSDQATTNADDRSAGRSTS